MSSKGDTQARKADYFEKVQRYFSEYSKVFVVNVDNVGSQQMHKVRKAIRGDGVVLMGKNTMMRKAMRACIAEQPEVEKLMPHVYGNIGFVFTNGDLNELRSAILAERVAAPAKAGAIAPCDVHVPAGNTGIEPGKTSFFQALGIPTKIAKGTIEIINDVHLIKTGAKVGASEASLLNMLNISPFSYGLTIMTVYDNGSVFDPSILDISDEILEEQLLSGIKQVAALSLALGITTKASVAHSIVNGYKNLLAVALAADLSFPQVDKLKEMLKNPGAFAAAAPAASASPKKGAAAPAKQEEKEESDADMGFSLFD